MYPRKRIETIQQSFSGTWKVFLFFFWPLQIVLKIQITIDRRWKETRVSFSKIYEWKRWNKLTLEQKNKTIFMWKKNRKSFPLGKKFLFTLYMFLCIFLKKNTSQFYNKPTKWLTRLKDEVNIIRGNFWN